MRKTFQSIQDSSDDDEIPENMDEEGRSGQVRDLEYILIGTCK